jgi:hypothetical protein
MKSHPNYSNAQFRAEKQSYDLNDLNSWLQLIWYMDCDCKYCNRYLQYVASVIQSNNQVRNLVSSCNCNVFNKHLQDISWNDNLSFQSNNHFNYNILNSRLQYLDFTIAITANQYLQSPSRVQSVPRADDHNSSSGSASRCWVGRGHGGPRVMQKWNHTPIIQMRNLGQRKNHVT